MSSLIRLINEQPWHTLSSVWRVGLIGVETTLTSDFRPQFSKYGASTFPFASTCFPLRIWSVSLAKT